MSEDAYEYSGFERNCPEVDDGFYLVKNGITYKVDLPMDKTRFTKRINILTGEVYYPSNADRIRGYTDEELAEWIERIRMYCATDLCGRSCLLAEICYSNAKEPTETLDWLKQEAVIDE